MGVELLGRGVIGMAGQNLHPSQWHSGHDRSWARAALGTVEPAPCGDGLVWVGMLAGRPAGALDSVATAGGGAALVADVARAVAGGAVRQPPPGG